MNYGKKFDDTLFMTLTGGGLNEPIHICNADRAQLRAGVMFRSSPCTVYLNQRVGALPNFTIIDDQPLLERFNDSVITATLELTSNQTAYFIRTRGRKLGDHIGLQVQEPSVNLSPLYT